MRIKPTKIILLLGSLLSLTSCFYYAPKSVTYNGIKYVTNWYGYGKKKKKDLHVFGIKPTGEEPLFTKNRYEFWFTDKYQFDYLYAEFDDSQMWHPDLYVSIDVLDEAKSYYSDNTHYDYYIGIRFDDDSDLLVEIPSEVEAMDYAIEVIMREIEPSIISISESVDKHNLAVCKKSKDGLFMTYKEELVSYKQKIYVAKEYDGRTNTCTLYELGEYGNTLYAMFDKYHLL